MKSTKSGFVLVMCLLLAALFLVFAMGMLSARSPLTDASVRLRNSEQARSLAQAGLEDFRAKLFKDLRFPPQPPPTQQQFSYSETVLDVDDRPAGQFIIQIDQTFDRAPFYLYKIKATGVLGTSESPLATETLYAEIDTCPYNRADETQPNLERYRALTIQEIR